MQNVRGDSSGGCLRADCETLRDQGGVKRASRRRRTDHCSRHRTRVESWNWFGDASAGDYTYAGSLLRIGLSQSKKTIDWQAEVAVPFLLGLPTDAMAPGAQGALGPGANYYVAHNNHADTAQAFVKQAAVRFKQLGGVEGQSLKIGRLEFIDGTEATPKDPTLAALKRERIAHRLLGTFSFSHVGRSFDGAQRALNLHDWNVAALALRQSIR